jgi:signal transduction histidine kinase
MKERSSVGQNGKSILTQPADSITERVADSLSDSAALLDHALEHRAFADYWRECLALIRHRYDAQLVALRLFQTQSIGSDTVLQVGQTKAANLARIQRWEEALKGAPQPEFRQVEVDDIEVGVGRQNEDLPILHLRLRSDGILRGGISLVFTDDTLPAPEEYPNIADFVRFFAGNALRAQELQETRHRLEKLSLVYQVSQSITSSLDLDTVLKETTELAASVLGAQASTLFIVDHQHRELIFSVPTGTAGGLLREMHIPINQGVAGWVATTGESIIVNEPKSDRRFAANIDAETGFTTENIVCVPLRVHDRIVGVLEVLNKTGGAGFTEEDKHWLETMGIQAAIALENARLYNDLRKEQERIIKAEEEVRHQLARDLHDGAAQMLSLIIMNVDVTRRLLARKRFDTVLSELDLLEDLARQANREVRTLLFELRPIILQSRGLVQALRAYHEQLTGSMKCAVHLDVEDLPYQLQDKAATNIFSVVQEAVNNIRKHAQAANCYIRLHQVGDELQFEIEDDGRGFDKDSVEEHYEERGSLGLLNMHERIEMLGGGLEIHSPSPGTGRGTLIHGHVPVEKIRR